MNSQDEIIVSNELLYKEPFSGNIEKRSLKFGMFPSASITLLSKDVI